MFVDTVVVDDAYSSPHCFCAAFSFDSSSFSCADAFFPSVASPVELLRSVPGRVFFSCLASSSISCCGAFLVRFPFLFLSWFFCFIFFRVVFVVHIDVLLFQIQLAILPLPVFSVFVASLRPMTHVVFPMASTSRSFGVSVFLTLRRLSVLSVRFHNFISPRHTLAITGSIPWPRRDPQTIHRRGGGPPKSPSHLCGRARSPDARKNRNEKRHSDIATPPPPTQGPATSR